MKYDERSEAEEVLESRPAWGGWIEIDCLREFWMQEVGPAPHGAGGLKYLDAEFIAQDDGPAPHGAGGLKSRLLRCRL